MKKPAELALIGAVIGIVIVLFGWWSLLIGLFALVGYVVGCHLDGTLDLSAAWRALTGNKKSTSK